MSASNQNSIDLPTLQPSDIEVTTASISSRPDKVGYEASGGEVDCDE